MDAARTPSRTSGPLPIPEARPWALGFIVLAILALAAVPIYTSREIAREEIRISRVLEPAQQHAADLALVQARQMLRFREYLLTGDIDAKIRYQALLADEEESREHLFALLDRMEVDVRQVALPLFDASMEWHQGHRAALESDTARRAFLPFAEEDQTRYERMLLNSRTFRDRVGTEMDEGRAAAAAARDLQVRLTVALLVLALLATVAVAVVGRRLRGVIDEATLRRRDAVRARWEVDAILEATGDGVLGLDLDGQVLTLNATGSRMLGFTEEEARGRGVHELLHGAAPAGRGHAASACPLLEAIEGREAAERVDDTVWHRRGRPLPVQWTLRPRMDGRVVRGAVVTVTDMTAVRAAEQALKDAVRAREETMAVVSHDLRNPLGSISAAAELLLEVPLDESRTRRQLETIRKAAERSNRLIEDLLDVARIEGGGLSVRPVPLAVRTVLDEAVAVMRPRAREKEIGIEIDVAPSLPPVRADRHRMIQVVENLLANAVRHTPVKGSIVVSARRRPEGSVAIGVSDTGDGISPADQARLFDRFWRRDRSDRSGAGLGLAIVKGIVEAHGGRVEVESEKGRGSTFTVVLPVADGGPRPDASETAAATAGRGPPSTPGGARPGRS